MSPEVSRTSPCWDCGSLSPWRRIAVESVIHARSKADGGPYRSYQCPACRIEVGALPSPVGSDGGWMLYPLRGLDEPGLLDRLLPAAERNFLERAHRWWRDNRARVEQYRRGLGDTDHGVRSRERGAESEIPKPAADAARRDRAASQRRTATTQGGSSVGPRTRRNPPPPRPPREATPPRPADPLRAALGLAADAGLPEIRRAYRALAKRWHPDRVGGDAAAQREAARRFREIRAAYESLVAQLS